MTGGALERLCQRLGVEEALARFAQRYRQGIRVGKPLFSLYHRVQALFEGSSLGHNHSSGARARLEE